MLDIILLVVLVIFAIRGFKQGLIKEVFSILAIIIAALLAFLLADKVKFVVRDLIRVSIHVARLLAFLGIFVFSAIVFNLLVTPFSKLAELSLIRPVDKVAGVIIGILEGIIATGIMLSILSTHAGVQRAIENSTIAKAVVDAFRAILSAIS